MSFDCYLQFHGTKIPQPENFMKLNQFGGALKGMQIQWKVHKGAPLQAFFVQQDHSRNCFKQINV